MSNTFQGGICVKKWKIWIALAALLLSGCAGGEQPVLETMNPEACAPVEKPAAGVIQMDIPGEAAAQTMSDPEAGEVYTWEDNTLQVQTLSGGDIRKTLEPITGMDYDSLTVMRYEKQGMTCYQTVWSTTGENGVQLGRALVADDGVYHYCVSFLSPEEKNTQDIYDSLCASFSVRNGDAGK